MFVNLMHYNELIRVRFWHQVLFDLGYTKHPEPFQKLVHQGMILGTDGEKVGRYVLSTNSDFFFFAFLST